MTGWNILRSDDGDLWLVQLKYNRWFIYGLWFLFHGLSEDFVKEKSHKTFLEMPIGNHLEN